MQVRLSYLHAQTHWLASCLAWRHTHMLRIHTCSPCRRITARPGRTELARSQQKLDGLQKLARTLQAEHKVLQLEVQHRTEASDRVQGIIQVPVRCVRA